MRSKGGKWYINDGTKDIVLDRPQEAWQFVFYMRQLRIPTRIKTNRASADLYPVRSLIPHLARGCKRVVNIQN